MMSILSRTTFQVGVSALGLSHISNKYDVTDEPPSRNGASHCKVTDVTLTPMHSTLAGADGGPAKLFKVIGSLSSGALMPSAFSAKTCTTY